MATRQLSDLSSFPDPDLAVAIRCPHCHTRQTLGVISRFTAKAGDQTIRSDWAFNALNRKAVGVQNPAIDSRPSQRPIGFVFLGKDGRDAAPIVMRCRRGHTSKPIMAEWLIDKTKQAAKGGYDSVTLPKSKMA